MGRTSRAPIGATPRRREAALDAGSPARTRRAWLRTGDLGFLDEAGELFVTGRIKDLIIVRGINHYPQDIERTVQSAHPAFRANCGAAFAVADEGGEETLVIVQEIERTERNRIDPAEMKGLIRENVTEQHELFARHIVLIRPGTLPKTTSGKIQRSLARKLWLEGDSRISAPAWTDQKSILAASPSLMLSAIPSLILLAMIGR